MAERRSELRTVTNDAVFVTPLSGGKGAIVGRSKNFSGRGMCIWLPEPIPTSVPVQIEFGEALLLGEACYCTKEETGYQIGLRLNQVLMVTSQLRNLMKALQKESAPVLA